MNSQGTVDRLMTIAEVLQMTGFSRSSIYVMMREGTFPTALKTGNRGTVGVAIIGQYGLWRESEVREWERSRPRDERRG